MTVDIEQNVSNKQGKKTKFKLKFTHYNPNTPEKTRELLKDIIVQMSLYKNKNRF